MTFNASVIEGMWRRFSGCVATYGAEKEAPRTVVLAAHPDDETIGASGAIAALKNCAVIFLTDGAPREVSLRSAESSVSREEYSRLRSVECQRALNFAGVRAEQIFFLRCVDQEAIHRVAELVYDLLNLLRRLRPEIVITHAYEGGHPDHDAASLITFLANEVLSGEGDPVPLLVEMTSYHARNGFLVTGEFLDSNGDELVLRLSPEQRRRKQSMLDAYASQAAVLESFNTETEMLRPAARYDFTRAPHDGKLWYECLGWSMSGNYWRELAKAALAEVEQNVCR